MRLRRETELVTFPLFILVHVLLVQLVLEFSHASLPGSFASNNRKSSRRLAPCQVCRSLVQSFQLGFLKTEKGHYGGGDTAWEEENNKVYKNSELRLVEIQEGLCTDLSAGQDQCYELATENEHLLEDWWNTHQRNGGDDLVTFLCINQLKICCPENHYGPDCLPCSGHPGRICSGHGKCKGNGTRKGNGDCICEKGYTSKLCDACAVNFYEAFKDSDKILCSACHKACQGGCSGAGAKGCVACQKGWETDQEQGCIDLNECILEAEACKQNQFCVNTEGSYNCIDCDKACDGCNGDGPDMCVKCAEGYFLKDKICIGGSAAERSYQANATRYLTYLGLCVATCIIFQKNVAVASITGLFVGVYITASEYLLKSPNQ